MVLVYGRGYPLRTSQLDRYLHLSYLEICDEWVTAADVADAIGGDINPLRVSALAKQLRNAGKVITKVDLRETYFSVPGRE